MELRCDEKSKCLTHELVDCRTSNGSCAHIVEQRDKALLEDTGPANKNAFRELGEFGLKFRHRHVQKSHVSQWILRL